MTTSTIEAGGRIAIDLDGVLTEHPAPLAIAANSQFDLDLPTRAFVDSAGLNVPLEVREWVYAAEGPAAQLRPAVGAQAFLTRVLDLFGEENVMILTARPEGAASMTLNWLEQHGFPFVSVRFADEKMAVARKEGCSLAIEDSERHARNYAAGGIRCLLLGNHDVADDNITLVADFDEIVVLLASLKDREPQVQLLRSILPPRLGESLTRNRIVVSDNIHPAAHQELSAFGDVVDIDGTDVGLLLETVRDADALVVRSETQVTQAVLDAGKSLKVVARAGAGIDNIDLDAATRAGVLVLNAPGANAVSAGEHTIALLLAITRQIPVADASTRAGKWERKLMRPVDLKGRTIGIVGLGRVGSVVASRLKAFEMRVVAADPFVSEERFKALGVEQVDFDQLLAIADVVTFHVPSTALTRHMLGKDSLRKLKRGAIVLNVARGDVVDQVALADALRSGHVSAAGVDVFPSEPTRESPLFDLPNVIVTPHIGGSSAEALEAVGKVISSSTIAALRGEAVANAANLPPATLEAPTLRRLTTVSGAAGKLMAVLTKRVPESVSLKVTGAVATDIAEHALAAALAEALQHWLDRRVTAVNARVVAEELGIRVPQPGMSDDHVAIPQFEFSVHGETSHVVNVTWDRAQAGITSVDRFGLEKPLAGQVLITHHTDQPGVIGRIATILGRYDVNVAGMQVGRVGGPRTEAMMVTSVDDDIPAEALEEIRQAHAINDAVLVSLPPLEPVADPIAVSAMVAAGRVHVST